LTFSLINFTLTLRNSNHFTELCYTKWAVWITTLHIFSSRKKCIQKI